MVTLIHREKPIQPRLTILGKLKQELPFVTSVGNVPNMPRDVMSLCPRHRCSAKLLFLPSKKLLLSQKPLKFSINYQLCYCVTMARPRTGEPPLYNNCGGLARLSSCNAMIYSVSETGWSTHMPLSTSDGIPE